jgi:hypothetical protein
MQAVLSLKGLHFSQWTMSHSADNFHLTEHKTNESRHQGMQRIYGRMMTDFGTTVSSTYKKLIDIS